ncbi:MAG: hypothetical protein JWQ30_595 [Sediminibacterium sp.]|nr:hypothetical protein [Sediminibacterium sp.]
MCFITKITINENKLLINDNLFIFDENYEIR